MPEMSAGDLAASSVSSAVVTPLSQISSLVMDRSQRRASSHVIESSFFS